MKTLLSKEIKLTSALVTKSNLSMRVTKFPNRSLVLNKDEAKDRLLALRQELLALFEGKPFKESFIGIDTNGSIKIGFKDKSEFNSLCDEDLIVGDIIDVVINLRVYEHPLSPAIKAFAKAITIIKKTEYVAPSPEEF